MKPIYKAEVFLHSLVSCVAIICLTIILGFGDLKGEVAGALIGAVVGVHGLVSSLATLKYSNGNGNGKPPTV